MKGYIQIYTGNGKGKTTAALGLALRAAGNGLQVFIGQFVKGKTYSEIQAIHKFLPHVTLRQYGRAGFIHSKPAAEDIEAARKGLEHARHMLHESRYDMVILDEISIALHFNLFEEQEVLDLLDEKPENTELILTGRYFSETLLQKADLVTDMREVRHYFQQGVQARPGIEY